MRLALEFDAVSAACYVLDSYCSYKFFGLWLFPCVRSARGRGGCRVAAAVFPAVDVCHKYILYSYVYFPRAWRVVHGVWRLASGARRALLLLECVYLRV